MSSPFLFNGNKKIVISRLFKDIRNSFTYEFWVKPLSSQRIDPEASSGVASPFGMQWVIGAGHGGIHDAGAGVSAGTNGISVYEHGSYYLPARLVWETSITDWTHVAVVYNNKTPSLYIDGVWKKTGEPSPRANVFASGLFGALEPYGYFTGYLKKICIWDHARTPQQIADEKDKELTDSEPGLIGYWLVNNHSEFSFDETVHSNHNKKMKIKEKELWDLKILYVKSGDFLPYTAIHESIIDSLHELVRDVHTISSQEDIVERARIIQPDLMLALNGLDLSADQITTTRLSGVKTAVWFTDDPYILDATRQIAPHYDYIFTIESNCIPFYKQLGCSEVHYLPLGMNPAVFRPKKVNASYQSDVCFVGRGYRNRIRFFNRILPFLAGKKVLIVGDWWERLENYSLYKQAIRNSWVSAEETANYYNGAKIVLNLHRQHDDNEFNLNSHKISCLSVNPRTFEISGCKTLQLTDFRDNLPDLYSPDKEIAIFSSPQECVEKINYFLQHEEKRNEIALRGYLKTIKMHLYKHRLSQMLRIVTGSSRNDL